MNDDNRKRLSDALSQADQRGQDEADDAKAERDAVSVCHERFWKWADEVLIPKAEEVKAEVEAGGRGFEINPRRERGERTGVELNVKDIVPKAHQIGQSIGAVSFQPHPEDCTIRVHSFRRPPPTLSADEHFAIDDLDADTTEAQIVKHLEPILRGSP